jgi:outer membrane protein assembly factor BamB
MLATIDDVEQIVMWHRGVLAGFDPTNGKRLWEYRWRTNRPIPQPLPIGDGKFFLTIGYGAGCSMIRVNKSDRGGWSTSEIFQDERSGSKVPSALFYNGHIYTNSNDNKRGLQCLDASGKVRWETGRRQDFGLGSLIIADGVILILNGENGDLVMAEANSNGYKELARASVLSGPDVWAPLALSDGMLVLRDQKQMKCVYVGADKARD